MSSTNPSIQELLRANNASIGELGAKLLNHEVHWRYRFHFFKARGYNLRPRYHPDWTPSWESDPDQLPSTAEDFFPSLRGHLIDATRREDSRPVYIKKVFSDGQKLDIAVFLSQPQLRKDPRNHCVPILDSFPDDQIPNLSYIAMPLLRKWYDPPLESVGEVIKFVDQMIEGLAFMHEHHIAHRDCAANNLFVDPGPMYPEGFHPVMRDRTPDGSRPAPFCSRAESDQPIKYFIADFDMSVYIPAGEPRQVLGRNGADTEVPELSSDIPYDPFKTDVFILGNVLRRRLHDKYFRLDFLCPLNLSMTKTDPEHRPSAEAALSQWRSIRKNIIALHRCCRLRKREEGIVTALVHDMLFLFKSGFLMLKRPLCRTSN